MRTLLFTLMSVVSTTVVAATVYKWVDDSGVTHFSDQPHPNAEKVQLKAPQTYSAPKPAPSPASAPAPASSSAPASPQAVYRSCVISEPTDDQMFMNTSTVTAGVAVQPAVRSGDQVVVTLDGQRVPGVPADGGAFTISPIDRGTHSIQVVVQDGNGKPVCQSPTVTFHVHQPSVLNPQNPVNSPRH
jgi:hypothetical protein